MIVDPDELAVFRGRLRDLFDSFGSATAGVMRGVNWFVEFPPSNQYDIRGMLSFCPDSDREIEMATVTFTYSSSGSPRWEIDITDRDAGLVADDSADRHAANDMRSDLRAIKQFLSRNRNLVVAEFGRT